MQHKDVIGEYEDWEDRSKKDFFEEHCWRVYIGGTVQRYCSNRELAASTLAYLCGPLGPFSGLEGSVVMEGSARL